MPDRPIHELTAATSVNNPDLLVLEQNNVAKKITGQTLIAQLLSLIDGHGGIASITDDGPSGQYEVFTIHYADGTTFSYQLKNGINGTNGYTPQRGVDYWTDEDVEEMIVSLSVEYAPRSWVQNTIEDYVPTVANPLLLNKYDKSGGEISGNVDLNTGGDAYNQGHVVRLIGGRGELQLRNYDKNEEISEAVVVSNVATPTNPSEVANKKYVDDAVAEADNTVYYHYNHSTQTADFTFQDVLVNYALGKKQVVIAASGNSEFICELRRYSANADTAWFDCLTYDGDMREMWFVSIIVTRDNVSYSEGTIQTL